MYLRVIRQTFLIITLFSERFDRLLTMQLFKTILTSLGEFSGFLQIGNAVILYLQKCLRRSVYRLSKFNIY